MHTKDKKRGTKNALFIRIPYINSGSAAHDPRTLPPRAWYVALLAAHVELDLFKCAACRLMAVLSAVARSSESRPPACRQAPAEGGGTHGHSTPDPRSLPPSHHAESGGGHVRHPSCLREGLREALVELNPQRLCLCTAHGATRNATSAERACHMHAETRQT